MLIVEGSDLVGKTTLCKKLRSRLLKRQCFTNSIHMDILPSDWEYEQYLPLIHPWTVCDRFHLSEIVYGRLLRRQILFSPRDCVMIEACLRLMGAFVIVLSEDRSTIERRWKERREEEKYKLRDILRVNDFFRSRRYDPFDVRVDMFIHGPQITDDTELVDLIVESYIGHQVQATRARKAFNRV